MRIAALDDDPAQTEFVCQTLAAAGHVCHAFAKGADLLKQLRRESFDLLVLDWSIPDIGGDEVLRWVRQNLPARLPMLFMTGRSRETDIAQMLNNGADDYVVKPVAASVLLARVGSLLRRAYEYHAPAPKETFGPYEFDLKSRQVRVKEQQLTLPQKEFELALLLFQHLGQPLSRAHILDVIWKQSEDIPSRTIDTHVSTLRSRLGLRPENGYRLMPIYGYGYRLEQVERENG
ncbi:DNA-binding response regulator [Burkholderia sp. WAC0059]|uniref:response regulator transcription factor n=1 Tax=Burkholderia sp. WAC0059 TaxID=2066022 RepID=UPI000C7EF9C9|nr:response regulator transcription factor [Burkholderia sp. WAC0059]PLZ01700.1 DNA-binding response regulator [Burkholderia sp. WAC0059]